jgi:hypothetical protein
VIGYEKPRLKITENAVYSYQDDDNYNKIMPMSGADCFFISPELPELHVKQSYMMLNYIKSQCPWATSPRDVMHYDNFSSTLVFNWYDYSIKASGRFGDLARSDLQHQGNDRSRMVVPMSGKFNGTEVMGRSAKWFQDFYKTDKDTFNNFTNGYMSVLNDPYCGLLQQDTNVFNLKHFYSKMYQMTF